MLELKNIVKVYPSGGENVRALKGVSLRFRNNEFVSILGPSGCGKTTMLNIIGGLDHYTEGDLVINGRSTKEYKDRDWDTYRNHSIGFVFQSYNLIPHQTVLSNVELALTLSGVSKRERRERAVRALEAVGLGNQLRKRPAQMSGGQMQRVAIARAIVNDPDIILADEPTGALDSETSVQVMDILKEIAKDRLVVMVTHNPDLAEEYSTRIIRMLDGEIKDDSRPIGDEELAALAEEDRRKAEAAGSKTRRASMSFATAFGLSLNNLFTKKGRTILTSFAGSIGIIGIALIYAVSQGTSDYIDTVQEETLSTYPLSITSESADLTAIISGYLSSSKDADEKRNESSVTEQQFIASLFSGIGTNDLRSFKAHLDESAGTLADSVNAVVYSYSITPLIYTRDVNGSVLKANPSAFSGYMSMGSASSFSGMSFGLFNEMLDNQEMLLGQYDVLAGRWPEAYNEMLLVLSSPDEISDFLTYSIGLHDPQDMARMIGALMNGQTPEMDGSVTQWSYDDLLALDFRLVNAGDLYRFDAQHNVWEDMSGNSATLERVYDSSLPLTITGIACAKAGATATALSPGICYLPSLTQKVMERAAASNIVAMQQLDPETDVFSGKRFGEEDENAGLDFAEMITVDEDALASAFNVDIDTNTLSRLLSDYMSQAAKSVTADAEKAGAAFTDTFKLLASAMLNEWFDAHADEEGLAELSLSDVQSIASAFMEGGGAQQTVNALAKRYSADPAELSEIYTPLLSAMLTTRVLSSLSEPVGPAPEEPAEPAEPSTPAEPGEPGDPTDPANPEPLPGIDIEEILTSSVTLTRDELDGLVSGFASGTLMQASAGAIGTRLIANGLQTRLSNTLAQYARQLMQSVMGSVRVDEDAMAQAFQFNMSEEDMMRLMNALSGSNSAHNAAANLQSLGYSDPADPASISVYLKDFEAKERFVSFIDDYNTAMEDAGLDERVIRYTDITGVLMSSVTTIIDAVTYVLIAFVAISLIVSSIMIGVITLISVQERTKEIGILRAIGASKRNVSSMFNAETVIIGATSGLIGVACTYLLCIPINIILHKLTGISYLSARLPLGIAAILVLISMLLTLIAGIIPSGSAAKKDPVVALRTE